MRRVLHALLLMGCLFSIFACFIVSSHQAFAGSRGASINRSEPVNRKAFIKGFMDGRRDGYYTGLEACNAGHRRETPTSAGTYEDPVSYSKGYDVGYETGYRIGEYECKPKKGSDEEITPVITKSAV